MEKFSKNDPYGHMRERSELIKLSSCKKCQGSWLKWMALKETVVWLLWRPPIVTWQRKITLKSFFSGWGWCLGSSSQGTVDPLGGVSSPLKKYSAWMMGPQNYSQIFFFKSAVATYHDCQGRSSTWVSLLPKSYFSHPAPRTGKVAARSRIFATSFPPPEKQLISDHTPPESKHIPLNIDG